MDPSTTRSRSSAITFCAVVALAGPGACAARHGTAIDRAHERGASAPAASSGKLAEPEVVVPLLWQYQSAAPLTGSPVVTAAHQIVFSTTEGYVHGLNREGDLLWNYTTLGAPLGSPVADDRGRVYVVTQPGRIHAIEPDGTAAWSYPVQVGITSPAVWSDRGFLVFAGLDNHLWAYSPRVGLLWRAQLPAPVTRSLIPITGAVLVPSDGGGVWRMEGRALGQRLWKDRDAIDELWVSGDLAWARVAGELLSHSLTTGVERSWTGVESAIATAAGWVTLRADQLEWRDPEGRVVTSRALGGQASGFPVLGDRGVVYVPLASGELAWVSPELKQSCRSRVLPRALAGVLRQGDRLVVWSRQGHLAQVSSQALEAGCL